VVRTHRVSAWAVLVRQLRSGLPGLLLAAAAVSFFVGQRTDALVIGLILTLSVGLGFINEYLAERAGAALQEHVRYRATVVRGGHVHQVDVAELVPGDIVRLRSGAIVPADLRLLAADRLACNEAVLTGESAPVAKQTAPVPSGATAGDLASCAFMGTVVHAGSGEGVVVVATGARTRLGRIAAGLATGTPQTEFQVGSRRFGLMLARVAGVLTALILVINLVLARPVIDAVLFSLAIAVGITPQLLPAVVTTSRPGGPGGPVPDCDRAGQAAAVHRGGAAPTIGGAVPRRGGGAAHPAAPGPPRPLAGTPPAGTWAAPVARRSPGPRSDHYGALIGRPELPAWRVRRACRGELNCGRSRRPAEVRARWPNPRRAGR